MLNLMGSLVFRPEATASVADITTAVGTWLTAVLGWITSVYAWVIAEPLVVFFIAIGLCGAMIRWARRLVHF